MAVMDGTVVAKEYRKKIKYEIDQLRGKDIVPTISPILVGDNPGAKIYYNQKEKLAAELNIKFSGFKLPADSSSEKLLSSIKELNKDRKVHGIFLELPLPGEFKLANFAREVDPRKDIDCINPASAGRLVAGGSTVENYESLRDNREILLPATPYGVMELLRYYEIELEKKEIVIVGGGSTGLPLSLLMLRESYSTVTICEYKEERLAEKTRRADVLVAAVGKKNFITRDMVKEGAIVVDIGVNQTDSGITGDVEYEKVKEKASYITPVPGGVGPMTTTMIMYNTVKAAKRISGLD